MIAKKTANLLGAFALGLSMTAVTTVMDGAITAAAAADYKLRATANSNENDEDYDGLIVFKDYVERHPTAPSRSSCSSGRSSAPTVRSACRAFPTAPSISTSQPPAAHRGSSHTCRCSTFPICCAMTASPRRL